MVLTFIDIFLSLPMKNRDIYIFYWNSIEKFCFTVYSFAMHSLEIVALKTSGNTLHPLKKMPLPGYWDADHDRPRTRNTRHSNAQCTNICISKSPTFSRRMSILLHASVIWRLTGSIQRDTLARPLCEWINHRAKSFNCCCTSLVEWRCLKWCFSCESMASFTYFRQKKAAVNHFSTTGLLRCDHWVRHSKQLCTKIDCVTSNQDFNSAT